MAGKKQALAKSLPNAVKIRREDVKLGEATVNPFTGQRFASIEDQKQFAEEQAVKFQVMQDGRRAKEASRQSAIKKVLKVFTDAGITEEEVRLVFGRNFR